jgi:uncharacterized protein (DUF433 family)
LDIDPTVKVGKFVIKGTSILVDRLVEDIQRGSTDAELIASNPKLSAKDVAAAREYAKVPVELRRSFGAWADEAEELDDYLAWSRQQRKASSRRDLD